MIHPCLSVLVVDDHPLVRSGFCTAINAEADLQVCGEVERLEQVTAAVREAKPDVMTLDLNLADGCGWVLLDSLASEDMLPPTLVVSVNDELVYGPRLLRAGARGYMMKDAPLEELLQAIRKVGEGHIAVSDSLATAMLDSAPKADGSDLDALSAREMQVFHLIVEGLNNEEMAVRLGISPKTIGTYKSRLMKKLGARTTPHLISIISARIAAEAGPPPP